MRSTSQRSRRSSPRSDRAAAGWVTGVTVFVLGLAGSYFYFEWQRDRAQVRIEATIAVVTSTLQNRLDEVDRQLGSIAGFLVGSDTVTPDEFARFIAETGFVPGMDGVGVIDASDAGDDPMRPDVSYPVVLFESNDPTLQWRGTDLGANRTMRTTVGSAYRAGDAVTSRWTPVPSAERGVIVVRPYISEGTTSPLVAFAVLDAGSFVDTNTPESVKDLLAVQLDETTRFRPADKHHQPTQAIGIGDRRWALTVDLAPGSGLASPAWNGPLLVLVALLVAIAASGAAAAWSSRRRMNAELATTRQLNASREEFIGSVSHELRTPLTAVLGFARVLERDWQRLEESDRIEMVQTIYEQSNEVGALVQDLLVAGRLDIGTLHMTIAEFSVSEAIRLAMESIPAEHRGRIEMGNVSGTALGDRGRVSQIVRNLAMNAVHHGGQRIRVTVSHPPDRAVVCVMDNGSGVPDDMVDAVFEAFSHLPGEDRPLPTVGLGLYVARRLADLMGGVLTYRREGGWTIFELDLPAGHVSPSADTWVS